MVKKTNLIKSLFKQKTHLKSKVDSSKLEILNLNLLKRTGELINRFEYRLRGKWIPKERELFKINFENFVKTLEDNYNEIVEGILNNLDNNKIEKEKDELIKKFEEFYRNEVERIEREYKKRYKKIMEEGRKEMISFIKGKWSKKELKKKSKEFNSLTLKRVFEILDFKEKK